MATGRPDYTGSVVVEDIIAGEVTATISGTVTVSGAVTITSGTVTISGPVTVTGSVTVSGTVAISNATIAVTQSGTWNINTVATVTAISSTVNVSVQNSTLAVTQSGTWNIATVTTVTSIGSTVNVSVQNTTLSVIQSGTWNVGTVTTVGSITGEVDVNITNASITVAQTGAWTVSISGTANVTITSQAVTLQVDLVSGLRKTMASATDTLSGDTVVGLRGLNLTADTDYCDTIVVPDSVRNYVLAAVIISNIATTLRIYRDGELIKSSAVTIYQTTVITHADDDVSAGPHTYTIQVADNCHAYVALYAVDELMEMSSGTEATVDAVNKLGRDTAASGTVVTKQITLAEAGSVEIVGVVATDQATCTYTLKRDSTILDTFGATFAEPLSIDYLDSNLPAGTYTYTITQGILGYSYGGMALISDGGGSEPIELMPYLQNLNVGLDTRARLQPWYQPNFDVAAIGWDGSGVVPHNWTLRSLYTVPTDRLAMVTGANMNLIRDTAPTTQAEADIFLFVDAAVLVLGLVDISATVGAPQQTNADQSTVLLASETLSIYTRDLSTGGKYTYYAYGLIMEFDA